jgi:hypothetical protein
MAIGGAGGGAGALDLIFLYIFPAFLGSSERSAAFVD